MNDSIVKAIVNVGESEINMAPGHIDFMDCFSNHCFYFCSGRVGVSEIKTDNVHKKRIDVVSNVDKHVKIIQISSPISYIVPWG